MKRTFAPLMLLLIFTVSCILATNDPNELPDIILSKDVFEQIWVYNNDESNIQNVLVDKRNERVVVVTNEGKWSILTRNNGIVLCESQNSPSPNILGANQKIIVKIQDNAIVMANEGGNDIFVYDPKSCNELAEIHLDDLSRVYNYTIDLAGEKIVVLRYYGMSAFDLLSGDLVWEIRDYSIASQRTSGYLKAFGNYLFVQGEGEIRSIDPETGINFFTINSPTDGIYFRGEYLGAGDILLVKGASINNIQDQFIVRLDAKSGKILYKTSIDEHLKLYPIKIVNGRKLLYGYSPASKVGARAFCALYEIEKGEVHLLWQNEEICGNGIFLGEWLVARPYPAPSTDLNSSSTFSMLDVLSGEALVEQQFNMTGVTGLYSDDEYLYFFRGHQVVAYKIKK